MRHLKDYPIFESNKEKENISYLVLCTHNGDIIEEHTKIFTKALCAADYFIDWINEEHETSFEPYYDYDGLTRFYVKVDDNPDFEKANELMEELVDNHTILTIHEIPLYTKNLKDKR